VPISVLPAPRKAAGAAEILHGVLDCLARRPDGKMVVIDFKTGSRRRSDRRQLQAYVDAVRAMKPGAHVDGLLVYAP
jgi:RecB family endonuclease NucS